MAAIEKLGGGVLLSEQSGPKWLRSLVGEDFLQSVESVQLDSTQVTDSGLEHLKGLSQLKSLYLSTKVTLAGVRRIKQALPNCTIYP